MFRYKPDHWAVTTEILQLARDAHPSAGEGIDHPQKPLRAGDFVLIVGCDGICEDMSVMADHLRYQGAKLALVELQMG